MAHRHQPDRGAPALTPTPGPSVCMVLQMNIHHLSASRCGMSVIRIERRGSTKRREWEHGKACNKVAVLAGASKGIGAAIARHLASEGAAIVVNYSTSKDGADRVVRDIVTAGG